jgi:hypothetical protein
LPVILLGISVTAVFTHLHRRSSVLKAACSTAVLFATEKYKLVKTKQIFLKLVSLMFLGCIKLWNECYFIIVDDHTSLTVVV